MSILDSIFNGDKSFFESINFNDFNNSNQIKNLHCKLDELENEFCKNISEERQKEFEEISGIYAELSFLEIKFVFKAAFALGVKLMDEVYNSDLFDM